MELIAYLAAFGVILLIAGMAFYVGREKQAPPQDHPLRSKN